MAPKHSLEGPQADEKRKKPFNSRTSDSRSLTPAGISFSVQYISSNVKGRRQKTKRDPVHTELQVSPFVTKSASSNGELDQYYTVTPHADWESMKSYKNFISK